MIEGLEKYIGIIGTLVGRGGGGETGERLGGELGCKICLESSERNSMRKISQKLTMGGNFEEYLSNFVIIVNTVRFTLTDNLRITLLTLQYLKSLVILIFEENKVLVLLQKSEHFSYLKKNIHRK
jgi:hypothetical protein